MKIARHIALPLVWLVRGYQALVSPLLPASCKYYPSCSAYAVQSLERLGLFQGGYLAIRRVLRCHPWSRGGIDHVPDSWAQRHDPDLHEVRLATARGGSETSQSGLGTNRPLSADAGLLTASARRRAHTKD